MYTTYTTDKRISDADSRHAVLSIKLGLCIHFVFFFAFYPLGTALASKKTWLIDSSGNNLENKWEITYYSLREMKVWNSCRACSIKEQNNSVRGKLQQAPTVLRSIYYTYGMSNGLNCFKNDFSLKKNAREHLRESPEFVKSIPSCYYECTYNVNYVTISYANLKVIICANQKQQHQQDIQV
ncbi:hypothetical protein TSAR_016874 [Trichomalopsis sarcophagae]|uniref:Uncharacterized protein n=1 Tax=Trichomalopsis sarcophagae TaxID=543379 RepID=A0A232ENQ2_9HYME|nr:hypothetical protein TSAR_016874 [Trichomalopsis sarcophagae]